MCLAVPAKITALLPDGKARVELGGLEQEISLALVEGVSLESYVIVHVGHAIGVLDPEEAELTLTLFEALKHDLPSP